jgi:spore germination cell wall hydrolase CwlJ-like protein
MKYVSHQVKGGLMVNHLVKLALFALVGIFAAVAVKAVTDFRIQSFKENLGLFNSDVITAEQRKKELSCLALNIYREAGHEPFEGKVAVAQVTMNRVAHNDFPDSVCSVVYEKNLSSVSGKVICQFSWYCDSAHRTRPVNREAYDESMKVAKQVLLEGFRLPSLEQALFYHADYINPNWNLDRITKVGTHIFYKPKERAQRYAKL